MKKSTHTIDISWNTILKIVTVITAFWAFTKLSNLVMYLLFAALFAIAIEPLITLLEKAGMKRGTALAVAVMLIVGAFFGLMAIILASITETVTGFISDLPQYFDQLEQYESLQPIIDALREAQQNINVTSIISSGITGGGSLLSGFSRALEMTLFTFFFTVYMLIERDYILKIVHSLVPKNKQKESRVMGDEIVKVVGGYVRGQSLASFSIGIIAYVMFRVLGVPNALALALIIGLTDIIPVVGGLLGLIPAVLISLTVSIPSALIVVVFIQVYSTINNNVIKPKIYGDRLNLSPFLILLSTTAGLMLFGPAGLILALPIAAVAGFALNRYKGIPIIN